MLAKQVGQLAPGYWTIPFLAALFLIYAYAYLQISFRLDDYLITYVLVGVQVLCFLFTCFFFFNPRPNGHNINARSSCTITRCTPVRKLVSGGLTKMEVEFYAPRHFELLTQFTAVQSFSMILFQACLNLLQRCRNCGLMKENQALKI